MKNRINKFLMLALVFLSVSCNDLLDINQDPNAPTEANIQEVLSSAQAQVAVWASSNLNEELANLWSQYWAWGPGVALGPDDRYEYFASSTDGLWRRAYASALQDFVYVIDSGEPIYAGISKITKAYIFGMLVDLVGDVPYTEANQGELNFTPAFDDAATVYQAIIDLIDEAVAQIETAPATALQPGGDDLYYQGDLDSWFKFANSLKLKLLIRQAENGGPADLAAQIAEVYANGDFIESTSENAQLVWAGASGSENPLYARFESGLGNFYVLSKTTLDVLTNLNDPRLDAFYDLPENGSAEHVAVLNGSQPTGAARDYSRPSSKVYGPALPSVLMSATEVWFYRAEAAERFGTESALTAFTNAVTNNFNDLDVEGASDYLDEIDYANAPNKLRVIGNQLWIAMNGTQAMEGWITTRKFDNAGRPMFATPGGVFLSPETNSLGVGVFPSLLLYPQSEVDFNPNAPAQNSLTDKVFWDN